MAVQTALLALEGRSSAVPARPHLQCEGEQRVKPCLARGAERAPRINGQEWRLAEEDDAPKQPSAIRAMIGQHHDSPALEDRQPQFMQHAQPAAAPGIRLVGGQAGPRDRDGTSAINHTYGQVGESRAQRGGIESQSRMGTLPAAQHPGQ